MSALIWLASRRDLGWRRRRFVIAVAAITLVLALGSTTCWAACRWPGAPARS